MYGGIVVKALRYKLAGHGLDSPMMSLEFFTDLIHPVALWPWVQLSL